MNALSTVLITFFICITICHCFECWRDKKMTPDQEIEYWHCIGAMLLAPCTMGIIFAVANIIWVSKEIKREKEKNK